MAWLRGNEMRRASIYSVFVLALFVVPIFGLGEVHAGAVVVEQDSTVVQLDLHKGTLIKLDQPVSTVFVADAAIADVQVKSPRLIYLFGKTVGETTLYAVDDDESVVASMTVHITHNLTRLNDVIQALGADKGVRATSIDKAIILEGTVNSPRLAAALQEAATKFINPESESILNRLQVDAPTQVNLRVRVAEVQRSALKELGFNWEAFFETTSFLFGLASGFPAAVAATAQNIVTASGSLGNDNFTFNSVLNALADEGLLTVLAEPNLTSISGENATFLAGGEFPIPVDDGDNGITVEFKRFGVFLSFTPVVLDNGRISLRVAPEVSQLSAAGAVTISGFTVPALTTRQATTTVELGSGQSFAIAGLIQNNVTHSVTKFPGLGEVPVLGQLFRSDQFQRDESELVIIVTPYLVQPIKSANVADPTQGLEPPNDEDRILKGRTYGDLSGAAADPGLLPPRRKDSAAQTGYMID